MIPNAQKTSFIDLCIITKKANVAATTNQPDRPKKYANIWNEELQVCPKEENNG